MVGRYWKAIIAFLAPLVVLLTTVASSPEVQAAAPGAAAWLIAVGVPVLTGVLTVLKRNQQNIEDIDRALRSGDVTLRELKELVIRADDKNVPNVP